MAIIAETHFLKPLTQALIPAQTESISLNEVFRCSGLSLGKVLLRRFSFDLVIPSTPERSYVKSLLKWSAHDSDIEQELPEEHLSNLEDIAYFAKAQSQGQEGFLHVNSNKEKDIYYMHWNIFYVLGERGEVFSVGVRWNPTRLVWQVWDGRTLNVSGNCIDAWAGCCECHVICPGTMAT